MVQGGHSVRLERLTFVHNGDQGTIGRLIAEARGVLKFGASEHGSVVDSSVVAGVVNGTAASAQPEQAVRISAISFSHLAPDVRAELGESHVPCILGHSGVTTVTLLSSRSCQRVAPSLSDLRGKVRFGLAKVGWEL
jgi:hypothetical protein